MEAIRETSPDTKRVWMVPVLLVVFYAVIQASAFAILPERDDAGTVVRGGTIAIEDLRVGDCFDWAGRIDSGTIRQVRLQPCEAIHEAAAVGQTMYPANSAAPWPGLDPIDAYADDVCGVIVPEEMAMVSIMPTEQSWGGGDRTIVCVGMA